MKYAYNNKEVENFEQHDDGTISFEISGEHRKTKSEPVMDNFQGNAAYVAGLLDTDGEWVGQVVWEITDPHAGEEDACNWDKFELYE